MAPNPKKLLRDIRIAGYFNVLAMFCALPMVSCAPLQAPAIWPLAALFTLPFTGAITISLFRLERRLEAFVATSWVYLFSLAFLWLFIEGGEGVCSYRQFLAIEGAFICFAAIAILGIMKSGAYARVTNRPPIAMPLVGVFVAYIFASIVYWLAFTWVADRFSWK